MSNQSKSVYASVPFKFVVDGESLYIHADLAALHSEPLDRMINGHMAEAQKGYAHLEDVDKGTFVRFIEWAHKGYYTAGEIKGLDVPLGSKDEVPDEGLTPSQDNLGTELALRPDPETLDQSADEWRTYMNRSTKLKKGKKATPSIWGNTALENVRDTKGELKEAFISRKYIVRQGVTSIPSPRRNINREEDYTDVFLSHARLYVFAEQYLIQPLKVLALEELHATLAAYKLYPERTGDIIEHLRYVYGNTRESVNDEEDLRKVLTTYIGFKMDLLMDDKDFRDLMIEDGGSLLGNFITMVGRRISK